MFLSCAFLVVLSLVISEWVLQEKELDSDALYVLVVSLFSFMWLPSFSHFSTRTGIPRRYTFIGITFSFRVFSASKL